MNRLAGSLDPVTRDWAIVASGSVARLALGFVASVLIARALGPADFGVFAVLAAASGVAGVVADAGLSEAAVRRIAPLWVGDPSLAARRGRVFFWLKVGAAGLVFAAGAALSGPLSRWALGLPEGGGILLALALLGVVATALSGAATTLLQATGRFGRIAAVMLANSGLTALLALALAPTGHLNLVTALALLGIGTSLASFALARRLLPDPLSLGFPGRAALLAEGRPLLGFGRWLWVSALLAMLAGQLDLLLLNRWSDPAAVGIYGLALNLAAKVDVANHSLHTALLPAASALAGRKALRRYLRRGILRSALIGAALLPLLPLAGPLIELFYGPAYAPAAGLFRLLLGVALLDLFATPLLLLAFAFDRPRLLAEADGLRTATLALVGLWLIPTWGPMGAVAARLAARLAGAALILGRVRGLGPDGR